jgi:hypothetical protein
MYNGAILLSQNVMGSKVKKMKMAKDNNTPDFNLLVDFEVFISHPPIKQ